MRKSIMILVLVAFAAAPAMASVTLSGTTSGTTYTINYSISGPNSVRAFALDITVNSGTISSVSCSNTSYYVYPGSIAISGGTVTGNGTCLCSATQYPGKGQGGTGTSGITVEMGSLYASGGTKPASSGTLLSFVVSGTPCTATVSANTARGGVVMENPDESAGTNLPFSFPTAPPECLKSSASEYNAWGSWGKPDCWCYAHQCKGDADNTKTGSFWVAATDLNLFRTAYNKNYTQLTQLMGSFGGKPICSDFDHTNTGVFRVAATDLSIFRTSYNKNTTIVKCCNGSGDCTLTSGDKWNSWKP